MYPLWSDGHYDSVGTLSRCFSLSSCFSPTSENKKMGNTEDMLNWQTCRDTLSHQQFNKWRRQQDTNLRLKSQWVSNPPILT